MRIALMDVDGHHFPNLALMKLSAWHKAQGDTVEWYNPFNAYDRLYMSKVFTFSPDYDYVISNAAEIVKGGTGYRDYNTALPDEVEHICPDYSLYGVKEAYGFLTRGCVNRCPWCIVPQKEGTIMPHADIEEFLDGRKEAVLLDNNAIAHEHGISQIEKIVRLGVNVDFNQGLEARQIARNPGLAKLLARVKWSKYLRMAYDSPAVKDHVHRAIELLRKAGMPTYKMFFYVLIREDIIDAQRRIEELRDLGCQPFAQPYRDFENKVEPTTEQKRLARWCNHKAIFKTVEFKDYK